MASYLLVKIKSEDKEACLKWHVSNALQLHVPGGCQNIAAVAKTLDKAKWGKRRPDNTDVLLGSWREIAGTRKNSELELYRTFWLLGGLACCVTSYESQPSLSLPFLTQNEGVSRGDVACPSQPGPPMIHQLVCHLEPCKEGARCSHTGLVQSYRLPPPPHPQAHPEAQGAYCFLV